MWLLLGLVSAPGGQVVDSFDDAEAWQVNADGGGGVSFAAVGGVLRIAFDASLANRWGNLRRAVTVPADAVAIRLRLRVLRADAGAAMYLWLFEADGDGYIAELVANDRGVSELERDVWHDVRIGLGGLRFDPRGNGGRDFLSIDRMLLGCNYEPLEVEVDDLRFELTTGRAEQPLPRSEAWRPTTGPRGNVAVLDEPSLPRTLGALTTEQIAADLTPLGYGVTRCLAGDIADPVRLTRETLDLLILPQAPAFPLAARDALLAFLKAGGAVLSFGGYAFDAPLIYFGDGWGTVGSERTAAQMDDPTPPARINSRFGQPGDTMGLAPDQIGLFDPSCQLEQVAYAELDGRRYEGALTGWAAMSLAGLNSPVFPDAHGETEPLGQTYDSLGRPRGALGVLAHFFAGPFAGAAWGGFGVDNVDLVTAGLVRLGEVVERLVDDVYLHSFSARPYCLHEGEAATLSVTVTNRGRFANDVRLELLADGEAVGEAQAIHLAPGESNVVQVPYTVGDGRDFVHLEARLSRGDQPLMTRETGLVVWNEAVIRGGPRAEWAGNYLRIDGRPRFLTGTNQTGVMWHSPRENPLTWERDFQQMADRGMTIWRVLHFSPFGAERDGRTSRDEPALLALRPPEETIRETDAMVQLAQKHRLVLMLCAHDWIGVELNDEELEAQRIWNRFWAERYKDVPGLIWDIQNEPSVYLNPQPVPDHIGPLWREFCAAEYPGAELPTVPERRDGDWRDPAGVAYERFRLWLLDRWIRVNVEGLRAGDPDAVITVGYLHVRYNADKLLGTTRLDFSNMHTYESPRQVPASLMMIDRRAVGRGLSLGEFGQRNSHDARVNGQTGIRTEADCARFISTAAAVFGAGGAFLSNWCFRDLPDVIFPWGLHRADRIARPWADEFLAVALFSRALELRYAPPPVYLLMPDAARVGPLWERFDRGLNAAVDTLLGLDVPFAVLCEDDPIPPEARLILWPLAYAAGDATFDRVRDWVAGGGQLYLSGGAGHDELRLPSRGDRLAALGLAAVPPAELFAGDGQSHRGELRAGRVSFVANPPEAGDRGELRQLYATLLDQAGVARLPVEPDSPDVMVSRVTDAEGTTTVMLNFGAPRTVTVDGLSAEVGADRAALLRLGPGNRLTGALADGRVTWRDDEIAGLPVCLVSRDGQSLGDSMALLAVPLGEGTLSVATRWRWQAPVCVVGEVIDGRFVERGRLPVRVAGGRLLVEFAAVHRGLLAAIAEPDVAPGLGPGVIPSLHLLR